MEISVLIPDGESHMLIYVVNCLAQSRGVKIHVMSNQKWIAMRLSRNIHRFSYYPETTDGNIWIDYINKELDKYPIDVIMPIFETGIRRLIAYQEKIKNPKALGLLASLENFDTAINKNSLVKFLQNHNMAVPKTIYMNGGARDKVLEYPLIVKPVEGYGGGQGVWLLHNREEEDLYFKRAEFGKHFLIQEFIEGYDVGCSVLCKDGKIVSYTIQKELQKAVNALGPLSGMEFIKEERVYKIVESLMSKLNWSGIAHVDLRYDRDKGDYKIIEINTRFWSSMEGSEIAGVNFPYLYCLASMGEQIIPDDYKNARFYNLKGLIKLFQEDKTILIDQLFILKNTQMKYVVKDPVPYVFKFVKRTKNIWVKGANIS